MIGILKPTEIFPETLHVLKDFCKKYKKFKLISSDIYYTNYKRRY